MVYFKKTFIIFITFIVIFSFFPHTSNAQSSSSLTTVGLNGQDYNLDLDYITSNYFYYCLAWEPLYSGYEIRLYCSDEPIILNNSSSTGHSMKPSPNSTMSIFFVRASSMQYCVNLWNSVTFEPDSVSKTIYSSSYDSNYYAKQAINTPNPDGNPNTLNFTLSNFDIKNINGDVVFDNNVYYGPNIDNPDTDIENLQFSYLFISPNDYGINNPLYLHRLEVSYIVPNSGTDSTYYYSDIVFRLDYQSEYFNEMGGSGTGEYYYSIPFYKFQFLKDSQYVFILTSDGQSVNNTNNLITNTYYDPTFDYISLDTTNKLTDNQVITSFYQNNNDNTQDIVENTQDTKDNTDDIKESTQNIEGFLTDGSVSSSTEGDINSSLNFDNSNDALNNQNSGFFTRLTSLVSSLATYNLGDDTYVTIPLPNSHGKTITLHSQDIYNGVNGTLRSIINAFWLFVFMFYLWRFINKIYIAVSTGNILDTFSSSGEAITNSML